MDAYIPSIWFDRPELERALEKMKAELSERQAAVVTALRAAADKLEKGGFIPAGPDQNAGGEGSWDWLVKDAEAAFSQIPHLAELIIDLHEDLEDPR